VSRTDFGPEEQSTPASAPGPVTPKDAATIMLVRDGREDGDEVLEVCMLQRHLDSDFVGGAYVFPGGKVDDSDRDTSAQDVCRGRTDAEASALLEVGSGGLALWIAAIRECFEEAGVFLAYQAGSDPQAIVDAARPDVRRRLKSLRQKLNAGDVGFLDACREEGICLAVDRLHYFSHWITPELAPKRYDTRFFVAALPPDQVPVHDDFETVDTVWVRPADALRRAREGQFDVIFPTMKNLQAIGRFKTSSELLRAASAVERVPTILPRVVSDEYGFRILLPGDPGYERLVGGSARAEESPSSESGDEQGAEDVGRHVTSVTASDMSSMVRSIDIDGVSRHRDRD
jgi:8-oxo-dGTP pyrophosphatase MutT (NUDIX family)